MAPLYVRSLTHLSGDWESAQQMRVIPTPKYPMKKAALTEEKAREIEQITKAFTQSEFSAFVIWMRDQWEENPPALLAVNPPNHSYDVEDGTHDLSIGHTSVVRKRKHHEALQGGIFEYQIRCDGSFREILRVLTSMPVNVQQEAAMAFFLEYQQGNYLCNTPEWREVARILEDKSENLANPFYKGVCVAILEMFREEGWMD